MHNNEHRIEETNNAETAWYTLFFRRNHLLNLSIIILLVAGYSAITNLPRLEDPRIDTRNVLVLTPYPGASAERVEALVTDVIEDELRQLSEIKEIKSTSRAGISSINIELQAWVDSSINEQIFSKIRDRLGAARRLFPPGAGEPELDEKRGATSFTLLVALTEKPGYPLSKAIISRLSAELADQLRNVYGTEIVRTFGDLDEQIRVDIDAQRLSSAGLSIEQASQRIAGADPKVPAGVLRNAQQNVRLQVSDGLDSLDLIRNISLQSGEDGTFLRLGDVAQVSRGWQTPVADIALIDGVPGVFVAARMQPTLRVDHWTENAKAVIERFNQTHQGTVTTKVVFDQNQYTAARLSDLSENLLLGSLVVMLVVFAFMGIKAALIVGLALPLSAAFTVFSLSFFGQQIHQMSIFGIIIAIGLLIDNAIVITDEIRLNLVDKSHSRMQALSISIKHLFAPLVSSTLTTILGFMPILLLSGNIGDFIGPIAISVVMALIGSLVISLTIIASLAARFLPRGNNQTQAPWYKQGIQTPSTTRGFRQLLAYCIRKPLIPLVLTIVIPLSGFILAGQLGNVFFPSADRDQFQLYLWMPNGTAIEKTQAVVTEVDDVIRDHQNVAQVTWLIGGSAPSVYYNQVMNRDNTPRFANAVITAKTVSAASGLITELQTDLDSQFPQAKIVVRAFGQGPPISAPIGIDIFGPDVEVLNELGEQVRASMALVPGVTNTISSITVGEPEFTLNADRDASLLAGLNLTDIAGQLQMALDGRIGGSILEDTEEVPISIQVSDIERSELGELASLPIINSQLSQEQQWLPLSAVGKFDLIPTVGGISRQDGVRVNHVEAFLSPNATAIDASNRLTELLEQANFGLPPGYSMRMAGDADKQQEAVGQLATYAPVLLVLMIATLILTFNSVRLALVIGSVAVLSVGLGMLSLWISGMPIGFNPILGSAGLIGVAINGSIVVIAAINANDKAKLGNTEEIVIETLSCSRHILSTTVTTVGGFIPLLLFSEGTFWPPLAVVLAGGVGFSVMLSLVFTPTVVAFLGRRAARKRDQINIEAAPAV